jgi:ferredoxin
MSVQITFEPDGDSGLVAEGASIWEAAKRLGVRLRAECKGRGDCDSCAVIINRGAELLSEVTSAEEKQLGRERLGHPRHPERLACQAILAINGDIVLRLIPVSEEGQKGKPSNTFRSLPFKEKVGALIELEAVTITEALISLRGSYQAAIGKFLNLKPETTKDTGQTTKHEPQTTKETPRDNDRVE